MKRFVSILIGLVLVMVLGTVSAQEYADTTEYSFDDDIVEGALARPDGAGAVVRKAAKQRSLIRVRTHFIPEMLKSVEDI